MMVRKILQNIIFINYMAVERGKVQMVARIGGNTRTIRRKDMEHLRLLMETDISASGCRISCTGMEYTDGLMEQSIMDSGKSINKKVTDIGRVVMV
jgi:hypothetical protein